MNSSQLLRAAVAGCILALILPATLLAQDLRRSEVRPLGGAFLPEKASALDPSAMVGIQAIYRINSMFGVGLNVSGARTVTRSRFFRPVLLDFGTRVEIHDVQQEVAAVHYGAELNVGFGNGTIRPHLAVGGGGYTLFLGGESNQNAVRMSGAQLTGAVGLSYRLSDRAGVMLEARDHMLMDYDQAKLNPVRPRNQDTIFFEHWPAPFESKDRINAIAVSLGFTYHP